MSVSRSYAGKLAKEQTRQIHNLKLKLSQKPKNLLQKCVQKHAKTVYNFYNNQKCVAILKKIDPNSVEFLNTARRVEYYTNGYSVNLLKVVDIFNLRNYATEDAFENRLKNDLLQPRSLDYDSTTKIMFHVTRNENLRSILKEGLKTEYSRGGRYGKGIYLSEDPRKAALYRKKEPDEFNKKIMLMVKVVPGRTIIYNNMINPYLKRAPSGKDTVKGIINGLSEYVLYDNNRVNVVGVIVYR